MSDGGEAVSGPRPWMLGVVLVLGAALAVGTTMWPRWAERPEPLPSEAVARVEGQLVTRAELDRAVRALELDLGRPLVASERDEVLEQLIDELLLVEYGLAGELPQRDPLLRTQIARAVLDGLRAEVETGAAPSDAELRAHFEALEGRFLRDPRLELAAVWAGSSRGAAEDVAGRWRPDASIEELRALARSSGPQLPARALPPIKLRDYLGPEVVAAVESLEVDGQAHVLAGTEGYLVVELRSRTPAARPRFEEVREQVARDLARSETEAALRTLLAELRATAQIERGEP